MTDTASISPTHEPDFTFQHSSPHSLQPPLASPRCEPNEAHDYNFSPDTYDASITEADDVPTSDDDAVTRITIHDGASTRSSISSFPRSTISENSLSNIHQDVLRTPSKSPPLHKASYTPRDSPRGSVVRTSAARDYNSAFRNPSSVRALQMKDGFYDELAGRSPHRRHDSRTSYFSHHSLNSTHTSPAKRSSRSSRSSPQKPIVEVKKEFPLILLHCTLLPATVPLSTIHNDTLIREVLPEEYKKRWIKLQDSMNNAEVQSRGVLIPHPKEDYELLEERLLESLDLEQPRIRQNHYLPEDDRTSADSGFESASQTSAEDECGEKGHTCPDCGKKVDEAQRKWNIKVYAANGLMRAGAWSAAWREMEKVDVEIGVWMPEEARKAVEARIEELNVQEEVRGEGGHVDPLRGTTGHGEMDERLREVYGEPPKHEETRSQEDIDGLFEEPMPMPQPNSEANAKHAPTSMPYTHQPMPPLSPEQKIPLSDLLFNYIRAMVEDRRNILIALLSVLVVFYAMTASATAAAAASKQRSVSKQGMALSTLQEAGSLAVLTSTSTQTVTEVATMVSTSISTAFATTTLLSSTQPGGTETTKAHATMEARTDMVVDDAVESNEQDKGAIPEPAARIINPLAEDIMEALVDTA